MNRITHVHYASINQSKNPQPHSEILQPAATDLK
jgi:hypothetical protein